MSSKFIASVEFTTKETRCLVVDEFSYTIDEMTDDEGRTSKLLWIQEEDQLVIAIGCDKDYYELTDDEERIFEYRTNGYCISCDHVKMFKGKYAKYVAMMTWTDMFDEVEQRKARKAELDRITQAE